MPGAVPVGAGLAIAGNGDVDQSRVDRLQGLVTQPQALHHARAELFENNVVVLHQLPHHLQRFGTLEVQGQAALVAVEIGVAGGNPGIVGRQHPQQIHARRRLDAQDLGAHVRQQQRGEGPRQQGGEIQYLE